MEITRRGGVYIRMSQAKGEAKLEQQEAQGRALAKANGIEVVNVYVDDGISASYFADRPGWADMLADVQAGRLDVLLAQSEDRFTRQVGEKETLMMTCVGSGVTWLTTNDGQVDPATADGEFFSTLRAGLARMESRRKAERQRQSNDAHAAAGRPVRGGVRPFGYEDDKATPHASEAPLIQQAYSDLIAGERTLSAIRTDWNAAGVLTVNGNRWDLPKVEKVLRRARNVGWVQHRGGVLLDEAGQPVMGQWEPIIDEDTYRAALAILNHPDRKLSKVLPAKHLASSIAKCGACGTSMRVAGRQEGRMAYRCGVHDGAGHKVPGLKHVSIGCEELDKAVTEAVVSAVLFSPADAVPDADTSALNGLYVRLSDLQRAQADLLELVGSPAFSVAQINAKGTALSNEAAQVEADIAAIARRNARAALVADAHSSLWSGKTAPFEKAVEVKAGIRERFAGLTLEQQRALVRGLITVTVNRGRGSKRIAITHLVATDLNDEEAA